MNVFSIRYFSDGKDSELVKQVSPAIAFAENLFVSIAMDLDINPIGRHLFGLYHASNQIWLASNQQLSEWKESRKLEFRIRYRPISITKLRNIDINAFHYYFHQMRYDFINGKFGNNTDIVYGLAVTDMVREILRRNIPIESAYDSLDVCSFLPSECKRTKTMLLKSKIHSSLMKAWHNSNKNIDYVMQEYMECFISNLVPDYGTETYEVMFDNHSDVIQVKLQYKPYHEDGISIKSVLDTRNVWKKICNISDLCFISIHNQNKTVEIARKNGIPFYLIFNHDLVMKSFVSLLDGYYRLTEKWSFNICKEISSPSLLKLKRMKCHGPVGNEFAYNKLKEKGNNSGGTYILRESTSQYNQYKLDVIIRDEFYKTFKIDIIENQILIEGIKERYESFADLVSHFMIDDDFGESVIMLHNCIPSSEYDQPFNLLLCKQDNPSKVTNLQVNNSWPPIIPANTLNISNSALINNSRYGVRLASFQNKTVVVKEFKDTHMMHEFLQKVSEWAHLRNDTLIMCNGVTLYSPLSLVLEYLPLGSFDSFLKANQPRLKTVDLIESISYLARALWYLQENGVIHGHIRCHNLFVANYSSNCLRVKLSDPISDNDLSDERPWLSPEYFSNRLLNKRVTHSLDVWSFGTTVWQIFSYGLKPNCEDVMDLVKPIDCPEEVWCLICECWTVDCDARKQPHSIVRDISQILYEVYNSRRTINQYSTPVYSKPSKSNVLKSIFGSQFSLSSSSIMSAQSTVTFLTGNDSSRSEFVDDDNNIGYSNLNSNGPWHIDSSQLKMGKVLGEGCYGEVLKAVLAHCAGLKEEIVAVKRIKSISSDNILRDIKREIEIMTKLSHKNIVEIKGFVEEPEKTMLVMEYVELGSLVAYLRMHRTNKSVSKALPLIKFASDISKGMEYLESKSIVHRDLAARNILVASESHVKISDFGLAQFIDPNDQYYIMKTQRKLPFRWYAPESVKYFRFSHKSDIWSYGVVLWEMYSYGDNPQYPGDVADSDLLSALESGKRLHCPSECPLEVYQIMLRCWHNDSHLRPTFTELKHSIEEIV